MISAQDCVTRLVRAMGWSQAALALRLRVSQSTISRVYTGVQKALDYRVVDEMRRMIETREYWK